MIKKLLIVLMLVPSFSYAAPAMFCALRNSDEAIATAKAHSQIDKNRHCVVSCLLALKCNNTQVLAIGFLKEVKDAFGPGDADAADMEANNNGRELVKHKRARTKKECLSQCDLYYR